MWKVAYDFFFGWMSRPEIVSRMPWGQIVGDLVLFAVYSIVIYIPWQWAKPRR